MNSDASTSYQDQADGQLVCDTDHGVLTLRFNRPDKANALSTPILKGLNCILQTAKQDENVRAIVLTGQGDQIFSGGADLNEMERAENDLEFRGTYFALWQEVVNELMSFPLPTLALINGACVAGGLSLALACDMRIATENAFMSYPRVADGHLPGRHNLTQLIRLVGKSKAGLIMLLGYRVYANEAHTWGLVDTVVGADNRQEEMEKLLSALMRSDAKLLAQTKNILNNFEDDGAWE